MQLTLALDTEDVALIIPALRSRAHALREASRTPIPYQHSERFDELVNHGREALQVRAEDLESIADLIERQQSHQLEQARRQQAQAEQPPAPSSEQS